MSEPDQKDRGAFPDVPSAVRLRMSRIRKANTSPEMIVRRAAHRLGYRFRLHKRDLPGTPDLVFARHRKVIFVHGCFWHQHGGCRHATMPRTRTEYWVPKLARNVERDAATLRLLMDQGWLALILWECEVKDSERLQRLLREFLDGAQNELDSR